MKKVLLIACAILGVLSLLGCSGSSKKISSSFEGPITAFTALDDVSKIAKKEAKDAVLIGIVSSDDWTDGFRLGTSNLIDQSYTEDGVSSIWDYYFAKNSEVIKQSAQGFEVSKENIFGVRYQHFEGEKPEYILLPSSGFIEKVTGFVSKKSLSKTNFDSDAIFEKASNEVGTRFFSLLYNRSGEKLPREIAALGFSLTQAEQGPVWEASAVFPDDFGNKTGLVMYFDATTGNLIKDMQAFRINKEVKTERISKNRIHTYELRRRDFTDSQTLLQEWHDRKARAEELAKTLEGSAESSATSP